MSKFAVTWKPLAESQLADAWLTASDRKTVTTAQATVDRLLENDPLGSSRHLSEGFFTIRVRPLRVYFTLDAEQSRISIEEGCA
jgi:plasmid stabilization system protein ParE